MSQEMFDHERLGKFSIKKKDGNFGNKERI
jgi:hypothetical protein